MNDNTKKILKFLQENHKEDYTTQDLIPILGLTQKQIDGGFTMAIQKKGYGKRVPATMTSEEGITKDVKLLKLTEAGLNYDPDAEE